MKNSATVMLVFACFALGCSWQAGRRDVNRSGKDGPGGAKATASNPDRPPPRAEAPEPGEVYKKLRGQFIKLKPAEMGVESPESDSEPYAVLMEMGFEKGVACVISTAGGDASLYYGGGGGIIGGVGHETVRGAARAFVAESGRHLKGMTKTGEFPFAGVDRVRFYVLTRGGVYTAEAEEPELMSKRHALQALYRAGHAVITELRLISEKTGDGDQ